jgi:hypothetical protein
VNFDNGGGINASSYEHLANYYQRTRNFFTWLLCSECDIKWRSSKNQYLASRLMIMNRRMVSSILLQVMYLHAFWAVFPLWDEVTYTAVLMVGIWKLSCDNCLVQCFSNWFPRRGVRGSERRKCVMAEEFYLRFKICIYELKLVWRYYSVIPDSCISNML